MIENQDMLAHGRTISSGIFILAADPPFIASLVQPIASFLGLLPMQVLILGLGTPADLGKGAGSWAH